MRILIEDYFGYPVQILDGNPAYNETLNEFPDVPYADLFMLSRGDYHMDLELWGPYGSSADAYFDDGRIFTGGPLGPTGASGWYIPTYMLELDDTLNSYGTYKFQEAASLFSSSDAPYTDIWTHLRTLIADQQSLLAETALNTTFDTSTFCDVAATSVEDKRQCVQDTLAAYMNLTGSSSGSTSAGSGGGTNETLSVGVNLPRGVIYSPGENWGGREEAIVKNLGLYLDVMLQGSNDTFFTTMMSDRFAAQQSFLTYWYTPHSIFSSQSGVNLTRIGLPPPTAACM
ncbi:hypothetical protein HDV00_007220 [Rhizophlyctis rosea]|nr:hypothetical protein HDV00_007220 [Rhizophlyctis rosea]